MFRESAQTDLGSGLFLEYEDVLGRDTLFRGSPLGAFERKQFFQSFLSLCEWATVYYLWRPNLRDEGDNHIVELAIAGHASMIVTNNIADFVGSDLRFPQIRVLNPKNMLKELA